MQIVAKIISFVNSVFTVIVLNNWYEKSVLSMKTACAHTPTSVGSQGRAVRHRRAPQRLPHWPLPPPLPGRGWGPAACRVSLNRLLDDLSLCGLSSFSSLPLTVISTVFFKPKSYHFFIQNPSVISCIFRKHLNSLT